MKIIIENQKFEMDMGCKLLKLRHKKCPFEKGFVAEVWNDIIPATFKEIAEMGNVEQRRVGILCLGLDRLIEEVKPKLIDTQTIDKSTTWVGEDGELVTKEFKDTYRLYKVDSKHLNTGSEHNYNKIKDSYFLKFKDTSTDREYMLWVEPNSVRSTNGISNWGDDKREINAIDCIAWTIQTNVPEGKIEKIIRQGDCIFIKPKGKYKPMGFARHLTSEEYRELLVAES